MYSWLIIDGYNIINKWGSLLKAKNESIEFARETLNTIIQKYSDYKDIKVTIVYDGKNPEREEISGSPNIIFSKRNETADTIIEFLVYNADNPAEITVATDDNIQRSLVMGAGAWFISAKELEAEVDETLKQMRKKLC